MALAAEIRRLDPLQRQARSDGDAVMAARLAVQHKVLQPHFAEDLFGEFAVLARFPAGRRDVRLRSATKASTFGARRRTELMFQLTILRVFGIRAG
ncbi:MAG: hypothetical protein R3C04_04165 [Hyphomonas sp.]